MYKGAQNKVHFPNNVTWEYQTDTSGKIEYCFNEYGYRKADRQITLGSKVDLIMGGCSLTFGIGLKEKDTWPSCLVRLLNQKKDRQLSYLNVAQGGASNDYIARTVIEESELKCPKTIVLQFTYKNRAEYNGGQVCGRLIGPWNTEDYALDYYGYYCDEEGVISTLKNILLVQFYCESRGIKFLFSTEDAQVLSKIDFTDHQIIQSLRQLINRQNFVDTTIWTKGKISELAADNWHPGRSAQLAHAQKLYSAYKTRYGRV